MRLTSSLNKRDVKGKDTFVGIQRESIICDAIYTLSVCLTYLLLHNLSFEGEEKRKRYTMCVINCFLHGNHLPCGIR